MIRSVDELYELHPYPGTDDDVTRLDDVARAVEFLFPGESFGGRHILDVGCGTGQRTLALAERWPAAQIHGIDPSGSALAHARRHLAQSAINNVQFTRTRAGEFFPERKFDLVIACGVLHHCEKPDAVLTWMSDRLLPNGVALAWVYNSLGEHDRMQERELFRLLLQGGPPDAEKLLCDLGLSLRLDRYGASGWIPSVQMQRAADMDAFLNPLVTPWTFSEMLDLFSQAGFAWAGIHTATRQAQAYLVDVRTSRPENPLVLWSDRLSEPELNARFCNLRASERLRVLELLTRPTGFMAVGGIQLHSLHDPRIRAGSRIVSRS